MSTSVSSDFRIEILRHEHIPIEQVEPNPKNPRPDWKLAKHDPNIIAIAESIRTTNQHTPALVYEQVNHYDLPDAAGKYILLQGERRYTACVIGDIATLSCFVISAPQSELEEMFYMGCEDTFKVEWGAFAVYSYARDMAQLMDEHITSPLVRNRTGLSRYQLADAEKLFSLHPDIYGLVEEYERIRYESADGAYRIPGRQRHGVAGEFSISKAVVVWDIFSIIRTYDNYNQVAKQLSDYELQLRIAQKRSSLKALEAFKDGLLDNPNNPDSKVIMALSRCIEDPKAKPEDFIKTAAGTEVGKLKTFATRLSRVTQDASGLNKSRNGLGANAKTLQNALLLLSKAQREMLTLERYIERQLESLESDHD